MQLGMFTPLTVRSSMCMMVMSGSSLCNKSLPANSYKGGIIRWESYAPHAWNPESSIFEDPDMHILFFWCSPNVVTHNFISLHTLHILSPPRV
ncbi:hypothetical protein I7I53_01242 [Histoplasma capsulatum var. duboisii H88]|uniref:Uncharacterized protein n=1 Tax=Ajellomyces capsulatus (strain H88) TaxID=544711 RepID=A0A8A1LML4_AJEC8|nr:hypothetical protein I7I53_01242 [Histoplasma capsulatum var. duboisii H88]